MIWITKILWNIVPHYVAIGVGLWRGGVLNFRAAFINCSPYSGLLMNPFRNGDHSDKAFFLHK